MKAIVIGGGIGGLCTAIALRKVGIEVLVYERATGLREAGAGISLWANAIRALDVLDLGDSLRGLGVYGDEAALRTPRGRILQSSSYKEMARRFGAAIVALARIDLQSLLSRQIPPECLRLNHECVGFLQNATGVAVQFANGARAEGDLLIGADGLHSIVRAQLFGGGPPRYAGYTAWRAIAEFESARVVPGETWGRGRRFGIVPLDRRRVYWFATQNVTPGEPNDRPRQTLLELFRDWHAPVEALIDATADSAILRNDIYDRDPIARWTSGCVTLLGDAAHPMTPNLGQGACQAIEDALVLAVCLRSGGALAEALSHYELRRIPRTSRLIRESRRVGFVGQWQNPILTGIRNALVWAAPQRSVARHLDTIVAYDCVTSEEARLFAHG
jgi:2-polyprenyl-6-methoxyphenol hydroxylase-like FAD-dependent oxidoreductase